MSGTTGDINVVDNQINGTTISPTLVFNTVKDSITYNIPLSSPDGTEYQISNVSDDNTNPYITTTYSYNDDMNADNKSIYATMTYTNYLPENETLSLNDIHISVAIDENVAPQNPSDPTPSDPTDPSDPSNPTKQPNHEPNNNYSTSSKISAPNTGEYFRQLDNSHPDNVMPYLIIGFLSLIILIITILPKKNRIKFGTPIIVLSLSVINLALPHNTHADTANYELTILGNNISAMPNTSSPQNVVSAIFPNIYNTPLIKEQRDQWATEHDNKSLSPGNAIILKTQDDKYILMDTGPKLTAIQDAIYNKLKELQGTDTVTVDYFIISHLDSDHRGNAVAFMHRPEKFDIKNIVFKHEITEDGAQQAAFESIANEAASQDIHIVTSEDTETSNYLNGLGVTDYTRLNEGMALQVGQYLTLHIFNTTNVYAGKDCLSGKRISWTADIESPYLLKTSDDKYIYFDGAQYQFEYNPLNLKSAKYPNSNVTFKTTSSLITKTNGSGMNQYFYARRAAEGNICSSNPNSFGILAEIAAGDQKKYMYFTGDIENAGYSTLSSGANSAQLYNSYTFSDNDFRDVDHNSYTIPAEDDTAIAIYNKLASDAASQGLSVDALLNNIVLYQMSHHGGNNSERAVWKLKLNRSSGIYAIQDGDTDMTDSKDFRLNKTYYFTLGNLPDANKINVFAKSTDTKIDGVDCTVNSLGTTTCTRY